MITQRVRVTLEFDVKVNEEAKRVPYITYGPESDGELQLRARQQRLLQAMIADQKMLHRWMLSCVLDQFQSGGMAIEDYLSEHMPSEDEGVIFREIANTLSPEDRQFWARVEAEGLFPENSDEISAALEVAVVDFRLEELQPALV